MDENFNKMGFDQKSIQRNKGKDKSHSNKGEGLQMSDTELISLLKMPPKATAALRTKSSFQEFFHGMPRQRMLSLLHAAYSECDLAERETRVAKRLELVEDVLSL